MEREDHINKLRNKLNSKPVIEDMDALWNELEPRLPKQKKNRKIFFWLPVAGLLLLGILVVGYLRYGDTTKHDGSTIIADTKDQNTATTKSTNTISTESDKGIENKISQTSNYVSTEAESTASKSTVTEATISEATISESTVSNNKIVNNQKTTSTLPTNTSTLNENLITKTANNKSPITNESRFTEQSSVSRSSIAKTIQPPLTKSNQESRAEPENSKAKIEETKSLELNKRSPILNDTKIKTLLFPTLQSLGIDNMVTGIPAVNIPVLAPVDIDEENTGNNWQFKINTYALADWNIRSQTNLTEYGSQIEEFLSIMPGYTLGGQITLENKSGLFFGIGMEQIRTFEKFKIDNSFTSTGLELNEEAFVIKGRFIANEQKVTRTTTQRVLSYNKYTKTNIMPFVGYSINRNLNYQFALSPIINVRQNYSGYLINESSKVTQELAQLYARDNAVLSGYALSLKVSKQLMDRIDIGLTSQFRSLRKNVSPSNTDFEIDLNSVSMGLSLGYSFN